jgi:EmrB/QacA subfamily drug resistance transporter
MAASVAVGRVPYASAQGRYILAASVLGSGMAFLDGTVVNIALPTIGRDLDASLAGLQWTVNAYTLTLSGFLLLGGALGDRYGRRRIFTIGVVWFALASLACAVAPTIGLLIAARALQGVGGALLTPGSLALIEASFRPDDRGTAIGAWSGLVGVAGALGPFIGGWLIGSASWRLIFLINLPIATAVVILARRHVPESMDPDARRMPLDVAGAVLAAVALAGVTLGLSGLGWLTAAPGVLAAVAFVIVERRARAPLVPARIIREREFGVANLLTFVVYAALGTLLFLMPLQLQTVLGYTPLEAGTALLPLTVVMLLLSARGGKLAARIGPRIPLTVGPIVIGAGMALLSRVSAGDTYFSTVFPGALVLALGLATTVAPLTTTVLAAAPAQDAGVASAINNAVARSAGLIAVSVVPLVTGLSATEYLDPAALTTGFHKGMLTAAVLAVCGGVIGFLGIRGGRRTPRELVHHSCPLDAPTLHSAAAEEAA